ncbi:long-chain fatty acid--CoA ligase [Desertibacillus haloalkaliphilus]|nr:long-chain fatty acid--CoA ligase [Desertibacillus haloalkaliphilus]
MHLYQILERSEKDYPKQIAVMDKEKQWDYQELKKKVDKLATALHHLGFEKGDRLAVMFPNSAEYIVTYFAVQRLGGIVVQVNPMYQLGELEHLLENSRAQWFAGSYKQREKLQELPFCINMKAIYYTTSDVQLSDKEYDLYQLINDAQSIQLPEIEIEPKADIAVLQYTGGTTGRSKGVMLTHFNLIANIYQTFVFADGYFERPGERVLSVSPFFHVYGMTSAMNVAIFAAATIICLERFHVEKTLELMKTYKPTVFPGVPTMYIALLNHPKSSPEFLQSIKICNSGSAPMPVELIKEFEEKTGALIVEGYGLSESAPVTHRNPVTGVKKAGSIGIPIPNTESKIVDQETGEKELPVGEVGELIVKGPQVMKGYWNNEEETAKTIRDGWLYTGDLATMDEDGYFYIVGRKKDMIIAGGYNIYPVEIEDILYQHPAIEELCVFGVPDPYRGETVKAVIVSKKGVDITAEDLSQWCSNHMARYKIPKEFSFRDELPKTTVGKILRRKLIDEEIAKAKQMEKKEV